MVPVSMAHVFRIRDESDRLLRNLTILVELGQEARLWRELRLYWVGLAVTVSSPFENVLKKRPSSVFN